ncbi:M20/M25/M40 family metallo-hydrolase [Petropleomorpha daqingensis]|uniref:Zn-dependent M28 family amino/carboxypeptidase n=1 Tax=Petropleomorpha daqingensis TaxID=2026353 RepID=A0A853CDQ8_9ACTN|nr:M20/M25/M40 family metallo-hydrolase [Petropleomorpha daqingensis]NYJ05990.1 Zn-dependent M28 family amino/carboxypeptidase [Petropleomorpha daqingensis]
MPERVTGTTRRTAPRAIAVGAGGLLLAALLPAASAAAGGGGHGNACEHRANNTYAKLLECVTVDGVREHQAALQKIADNSSDPDYPGTRAVGTDGYADSVRYVSDVLTVAGYRVTLDPFEFEYAFPIVLRQLTPTEADHEAAAVGGSHSGELEGQVIPVDINLTGDRASDSGCEPEDFAGLDFSGDNDIALIQRGTCNFAVKVQNAQNAGAEAVVLFNQGNTPEREALLTNVAATEFEDGSTWEPAIPIVGTSFAAGQALAAPGSTAFVSARTEQRTDFNVLGELPGRNTGNVVMAGAHLDSVTEGPGINDDGSGTAALLEVAQNMAKSGGDNTLRFAFWGGEELGLLGSTDYVTGLPQAERDRIALYMNFDMIGSPNYVQTVYDSDQSTFEAPVPIPEGSIAIEDLFESYYTSIGEPYDDSAFDGRSDYQAFIDPEVGIASGGIFTGAEEVKSEEQQAIWGGTAGEQFDPCYHAACDTYENVDLHALDVNSDLIAYAMLTYAYSTESVNGVPGKQVPGRPAPLPAPAGPEGTFPLE